VGTDALRDSSSAAIAVCGLLELVKHLPATDPDRERYLAWAKGIMSSLTKRYLMGKEEKGTGHVFAVVGLREVTLAVQTFGRHWTYAGTNLQTGWQRGLFRRLRTRLADGLIKQIFKNSALAFKTIGANVRQVVGDHIHIGLLRIQARFCDP
jgi:hypothetical protein